MRSDCSRATTQISPIMSETPANRGDEFGHREACIATSFEPELIFSALVPISQFDFLGGRR